MSFLISLKHRIGKLIPAKKVEAVRTKEGVSLTNIPSVVLVGAHTNESDLKRLKKFSQFLKGEYGIREILILLYVDEFEKDVPVYLGHLKELDYFTKEQLNWRLKPTEILENFCKKEYQILIDLTIEESAPLEHIVAGSRAKMKIGKRYSVHEKYYDLIVDMAENDSMSDFLKQTEYLLSKLSFK